MPETPLTQYLRVQRDVDRQILAVLRKADADITRELAQLARSNKIGALVRSDQLRLVQGNINRRLEVMWRALGDEVATGKAAAAAAAIDSLYPERWLSAVMPEKDVAYLMRSARDQAGKGLEALEARLGYSRIPLVESVYTNGAVASGKVDEIVNSALARGRSAAELAKEVRDYVNPNTPGGARYASLRLARTEINNSFHATQVNEGIKTPWTTAMKWNLSGSHPVPDECNEYAESVHYDGGEAGVFKPEEVPGKPHPNCLCYTTAVTDSRDEFLRKLESGRYDEFLESEFGLDPSSRF